MGKKKKTFRSNKYYYNIGDTVKFNWLGDANKIGEIIEKQIHPQKGKSYKIKSNDGTIYPYIANPEQTFAFGYVVELVQSKKEKKAEQKQSTQSSNKKSTTSKTSKSNKKSTTKTKQTKSKSNKSKSTKNTNKKNDKRS